jgi:aminoglycoside/choline kinase family phosphotransferase
VLCDDPVFNSVAVEQNKWITGFFNQADGYFSPPDHLLTFTGIQVLEPQVLNYIPQNTFYSSIDAFKKILADGKKLRAFITSKDRWQDIGTPESYRQTAIDKAWPKAFQRAFAAPATGQIHREKLKGDGSERQWYRLKTERHSLIMADHGIREKRSISEVDAFVHIGQHLYRQGVSVPKIYFFDTFCGLVFLDDLGDVNLQQTARLTPNPESLIRLYKSVIDQLIKLSLRGADNFDPAWTYQTAQYDQELIIEKECRYFQEAFLQTYLGLKVRFSDLAQEFSLLADRALENAANGFMHRDMQSRNIMVKGGKYYFIDFQGGRMGPVQYDLASLLIDPYVDLPDALRLKLFDYAAHNLPPELGISPQQFRQGCVYCALTRNLQILGAFGHLSKNKGKTYFENYIPAALGTLEKTLSDEVGREFPELKKIVETIFQTI